MRHGELPKWFLYRSLDAASVMSVRLIFSDVNEDKPNIFLKAVEKVTDHYKRNRVLVSCPLLSNWHANRVENLVKRPAFTV